MIGAIRLDTLRVEDIDRLHARLGRSVGGTTAHHVHMTLRVALNEAERRGVAVSPVMRRVDAPRRSAHEIVPLTPSEIDALLAAAKGDRFEGLIVLSVTYGLRLGELLGMTWQNVDLAHGRITVAGSAHRTLNPGERVVGTPKTASGKRTLTLAQIAIDAVGRTERVAGTDLV